MIIQLLFVKFLALPAPQDAGSVFPGPEGPILDGNSPGYSPSVWEHSPLLTSSSWCLRIPSRKLMMTCLWQRWFRFHVNSRWHCRTMMSWCLLARTTPAQLLLLLCLRLRWTIFNLLWKKMQMRTLTWAHRHLQCQCLMIVQPPQSQLKLECVRVQKLLLPTHDILQQPHVIMSSSGRMWHALAAIELVANSSSVLALADVRGQIHQRRSFVWEKKMEAGQARGVVSTAESPTLSQRKIPRPGSPRTNAAVGVWVNSSDTLLIGKKMMPSSFIN